MSSGNIDFELQNSDIRLITSVPVVAINIKAAVSLGGKQAILACVSGDPASVAVAGTGHALTFHKGCLMSRVDNGTLYVNTNASAPSWAAQG